MPIFSALFAKEMCISYGMMALIHFQLYLVTLMLPAIKALERAPTNVSQKTCDLPT